MRMILGVLLVYGSVLAFSSTAYCAFPGDFNDDGDVDGLDLATQADGGNEYTLEDFAAYFGTEDCVAIFPDLNLEGAIREAISKPSGNIFCSDLVSLTELNASGREIYSISGLEYCSNLTILDLGQDWDIFTSNHITDINPLAGLINLTWLNLDYNEIADISPLAGLINLAHLYLWSNQIADISPLAGLINLTDLDLDDNQITDINPLAGLINLTDLYLWSNRISDVSPLVGLESLTELDLGTNQVSNISSLAGLLSLNFLWLGNNRIVNISPLAGLVNLATLDLDSNQITDISPLVDNAGIDAGDYVYLRLQTLSVNSCTVLIPILEARGVNVYHDCPLNFYFTSLFDSLD